MLSTSRLLLCATYFTVLSAAPALVRQFLKVATLLSGGEIILENKL